MRRRGRGHGHGLLLLIGVVSVLLAGGWWRARDRAGAMAGPGVYVALGASDTVGVGATRPAQEGWAPLVQAGLPAGTAFVNLGVSGATLRDVLDRQAPVAVDARPRWVSLWAGVNDLRAGVALPDYAAQLDQLLGEVGAVPGATVIVLTIPDLRPLPAFATVDPDRLDATVRQWNEAIVAAAGRAGAVVVDLYAERLELAAHPEYISDDGFHPSAAGYRRISELALAALRSRLGQGAGRWSAAGV